VRRSISEPLLELAARLHRRPASGASAPVIRGTERRDEIGEMARAVLKFRQSETDLLASLQGLESQARSLQARLAEEQRVTVMQRNFASMASHEFRTPLTVIDAHAQGLIKARESLGPDDLLQRAAKIRSAVSRMTNLMRNLLDSSRALDGEAMLRFNPEVTDATQLLREVCQLHREITPPPRAHIREALPGEPLPVEADHALLFQVFSNLVANAIKYSPGEAWVEVSAWQENGQVCVCVEDHGIGIRPDDQARIFERHFRGGNAAGMPGTGVGLYFVSMVLELHRAKVEVTSQEGRGSRFIVRLPAVGGGAQGNRHASVEQPHRAAQGAQGTGARAPERALGGTYQAA